MDSCGFKVTCGGGEMSCDCVELVLSSFITLIKKYDTGDKIFQPILLKYCPRTCGSMLRKGEESFGARLVVELLLLVIVSTVIPVHFAGVSSKTPCRKQKFVNNPPPQTLF
jgi:hypothetical protein